MFDNTTSPDLATDVDRLVEGSSRPAIKIAQRFFRTASSQQWKAAIWTANGDPIGATVEPASSTTVIWQQLRLSAGVGLDCCSHE